MTGDLNLLIVEDMRDTLRVAKTAFASHGYNVDTCQKDGKEVLKRFGEKHYDVLILDAVMSNFDAVSVIRTVKMKNTYRKPAIIVAANYDNGTLQREVIEAGADYFVLKPFDFDVLCERIEGLVNGAAPVAFKSERISPDEIDLEVTVTDMLLFAGIPANIMGYRYVRTAIMLGATDREILNHMTKQLYPKVAEIHKSTPDRVERSIRHAIEKAFNNGNASVLNSFFGYTVKNKKGRPSNSEFIALLSDKLALKIKAS